MTQRVTHSNATLWQTIRIQNAVIGGLFMREIYARFGRENIGFMWLLVEPALFTTGVIALWSIIHTGHDETPLVPFLLTGYMPLLLYRHVVTSCIRAMQHNQSLMYHRRITVLSIYLARQGVEILGTVASFAICMVYFGILGWVDYPKDLGLMVAGWVLYIWCVSSFGILLGALSERAEIVEKLWAPVSYLSVPTTGAFFMVYWMPLEFHKYLTIFPLINASEMIRGGYFGATVPAVYDWQYTAMCAFFCMAVGMYLLKDARRYLEIV